MPIAYFQLLRLCSVYLHRRDKVRVCIIMKSLELIFFFFLLQIISLCQCLTFDCDPVFRVCFGVTENFLNFSEAIDYCGSFGPTTYLV